MSTELRRPMLSFPAQEGTRMWQHPCSYPRPVSHQTLPSSGPFLLSQQPQKPSITHHWVLSSSSFGHWGPIPTGAGLSTGVVLLVLKSALWHLLQQLWWDTLVEHVSTSHKIGPQIICPYCGCKQYYLQSQKNFIEIIWDLGALK